MNMKWITNIAALLLCSAAVQAQSVEYGALLDGAHEVPASGSIAQGSASITLNPDNTITYLLDTANGLVGTSAHIHSAPAGSNGPVEFTLSGGPTTWSGTTAPLDVFQLAKLAADGLYLNVHSATLPGGEIRGQIRQLTLFAGSWHLPLGDADLAIVPGTGAVISNIGSSGLDGVSIMRSTIGGTMEDGPFAAFSTITEYDPVAVPVGSVLETHPVGVSPLSGLGGQSLATFGMAAGVNTFTALIDYAPVGSPTYTANVYEGDQLLLSIPGLTSGMVEVGPLATKIKVTCETELKPECCPLKVVLTLRWTFGSSAAMTVAGTPVSGDAVEFVPDVDPGAVVVEHMDMVATNMPAFTVENESIRLFGNQHYALGDVELVGIGSSGMDGVECVLGIGSSGMDGVEMITSPTDSLDLAVALSGPTPVDGSALTFEAKGLLNGVPNQGLGAVTLTRSGSVWAITADFSSIASPTQHLQVLAGGGVIADIPGHSGAVGTASSFPIGLGKLGGQTECVVQTHPSGTQFVIDGSPHTGDELRILAETASVIGHKTGAVIDGNGLGWIISNETSVPTAWTNLGGPLAGAGGDPWLLGSGTLEGGTLASIALSNAAPSTLCAAFLSLFSTPVPFKGGVLQAAPWVIQPILLPTSLSGGVALPFFVPATIPGGLEFYIQFAVLDAGAPVGVALSNAIVGLFP